MLSRVWRFVREHHLLAPKDGVLVACSAGPDSTALLDVLLRLRDRLDLELRIAYVHHGLRPEADQEAQHVDDEARRLGLRFDVLRVRVPRQASLQAAARTVRLDALDQMARKHGLSRVALGHTRTDQAETVLMRVIRGTGPRGLGGIPSRRGRFVRPLLCVGREEIEEYLERRGVSWMTDASNSDRRFLRIRVRLDVMPRLREINPRIEESLARLADNARDERGGFASPPLLRSHIRGIAALLDAPGGTRWLSLPGGRMAEIRVVQSRRPPVPPSLSIPVPGPGRTRVRALDATFSVHGRRQAPAGAAWGWFDAAAMRFPLVLRTRRPGDRIRLEQGTKKVSDLLIDAKVPRGDRGRVLLLCAKETVLWVVGVRQAAGTRPAGRTGFSAILLTDVDPVAMPTNNVARQCERP